MAAAVPASPASLGMRTRTPFSCMKLACTSKQVPSTRFYIALETQEGERGEYRLCRQEFVDPSLSLSPNCVSPDDTYGGRAARGHLIPVDSTGAYCPPCIALRNWAAGYPSLLCMCSRTCRLTTGSIGDTWTPDSLQILDPSLALEGWGILAAGLNRAGQYRRHITRLTTPGADGVCWFRWSPGLERVRTQPA